ncbi:MULTISPECIES: MFS transporter [Paenibacillus]|uniref:MFS transporter n=1 Tax=Paenibacillus TaxID=44249 RepID=UPI0019D55799|nr:MULTISPECIES: MFS transporter [Paenibacillus]MCY9581307.1 MFS transporter [Paenibacillus alvei]MCY9584403.1 MFS transporter [Paenibacillus alvei]
MKIKAHKLFYLISFLQFFMAEITGTTLILFILSKGYSLQIANNLFIVLFVSIMILEIPTGIIADRFGRKKSVVLGFLCYLIYSLIFLAADNIYFLILAQLFGALATCLQSGALESWVVDNSEESIDHIFATSNSIMYIAGFICGILGAFLANIYFGLPWIISIFTNIILLLLSIIVMKENRWSPHTVENNKTFSVKSIFQNSKNIILSEKSLWIIFLVGIFVNFSNSAANTFQQPRFVALSEQGVWVFGIIKTVYSLFMSLGSYWVKKLSGKYDDRTVLIFSLLMLGIWLIFSGILDSFYPVLVTFMVYEIGRGMYPTASQIYINKRISGEYRATILSLESAITRIGMCVGLFVTGVISKNFVTLSDSQLPIRVSWVICGIVAIIPVFFLKYFKKVK